MYDVPAYHAGDLERFRWLPDIGVHGRSCRRNNPIAECQILQGQYAVSASDANGGRRLSVRVPVLLAWPHTKHGLTGKDWRNKMTISWRDVSTVRRAAYGQQKT